MKNSLKELKEGIETLIDSLLVDEGQIESYEYIASNDQVDISKVNQFPKIYIVADQGITLEDTYNSIQMKFIFCDVMQAKTNSVKYDLEIKSDMIQAASKLFDNLGREEYFADAFPSIALEPFSGAYNNGLSGVEATVTFAIEKPCFSVPT